MIGTSGDTYQLPSSVKDVFVSWTNGNDTSLGSIYIPNIRDKTFAHYCTVGNDMNNLSIGSVSISVDNKITVIRASWSTYYSLWGKY